MQINRTESIDLPLGKSHPVDRSSCRVCRRTFRRCSKPVSHPGPASVGRGSGRRALGALASAAVPLRERPTMSAGPPLPGLRRFGPARRRAGAVRSIRTYGCQMNVHDSEKIATPARADVWLLTTRPRRKSEADRARDQHVLDPRQGGAASVQRPRRAARNGRTRRPGRLIGVGGCVAQQVGDRTPRRASDQVDFVFGTHNLRLVPAMVDGGPLEGRRAMPGHARGQALARALRYAGAAVPALPQPERVPRAFVTVMEGCDMFCSFCIVPLDARTRDQPAVPTRSSRRRLHAALDAQGVQRGDAARPDGQRIRSPRPAARARRGEAGTVALRGAAGEDRRDPGDRTRPLHEPAPDLLRRRAGRARTASCESLCPHVHLPAQSGSDAGARGNAPRYTHADRYVALSETRCARRGPTSRSRRISSSGFPGESRRGLRGRRSALVREARRSSTATQLQVLAAPGHEGRGGHAGRSLRSARGRAGRGSSGCRRSSAQQTLAYHRRHASAGRDGGASCDQPEPPQPARGATQWLGPRSVPPRRQPRPGSGPRRSSPDDPLRGHEIVEATPHSPDRRASRWTRAHRGVASRATADSSSSAERAAPLRTRCRRRIPTAFRSSGALGIRAPRTR